MPRTKIEKTDKYCVANVSIQPDGTSIVSYYGTMKNGGITLIDNITSKKIKWYNSIEEAKKHIMTYNECVIKYKKPVNINSTT